MADKAYITPTVLKWARESAKIAEETASRKVAVTKEKIKEWENGESQPTIKQAQTLAKVYKRPFAVFFLPDIPKDFQLLNDFRKNGSKPLTTSSIFIIREIQQKQAWISEANKENNEPKLPFVGRYSLNDNPKDVAADILNTLSLNPSNYQFENPIKEWIESAERNGIFVSRTSFIHSKLKLDSEELQGFAIADPFAPFIFINSDDWQTPQLFTLVHELSHIWIAESGISSDANPEAINKGKFHPIELFCIEVAANALMPEELIISMRSSPNLNSKELFSAAKKIGVSSYALLVRLLSLKLISIEEYNKLKKEADIEFYEFKQRGNEKKLKAKVSSGGPSYFLLQLNRNRKGTCSFEIPEIENFLNSFSITSLKAKSKLKNDITIQVSDPNTFLSPALGFSIKSQLGRPSTLVNASGATNFTFNIVNKKLNSDEINEINNERLFSNKMRKLKSFGAELEFEKVDNQKFESNLQTIDFYFSKILAELLLLFYSNDIPTRNTIKNFIDEITAKNPLGYNLNINSSMYELAMKKFLTDYALGMRASEVWKREYQATGGYLIVREDGELICYHFYFTKNFEDYLFNNTKLETPDPDRHNFGFIYDENGVQKMKLNLQIRFIK